MIADTETRAKGVHVPAKYLGDGEVNLTELPDDELLRLARLDVTRATL